MAVLSGLVVFVLFLDSRRQVYAVIAAHIQDADHYIRQLRRYAAGLAAVFVVVFRNGQAVSVVFQGIISNFLILFSKTISKCFINL